MAIRDATGYVPLGDTLACEICGTVVATADAHSIIICYAMPGSGVSAYQCANEQHFACSHEHAIQAAMACLFDHIESGPYKGKKAKYDDPDLQVMDQKLAKFNSKGKVKNQLAASSTDDTGGPTDPMLPVVKV